MQKQWILKPQAENEDIERLSNEINVSYPIANLLLQRGIDTYDKAKAFFRPSLEDLHNPFLMRDMDKAVDRLLDAIRKDERVLVFGDYDVDGTTSVALLYSFLREQLNHVLYYIPNRYNEGYGISKAGIDFAHDNQCTLIIALDCGIKAIEMVEYAKGLNIDFIICDHHEPGPELPKAIAVLDPKRTDCEYPFKELSACGVGFKFVQAYAMKKGIDFQKLENYLDLVAISIAADIVPIVDENRILAHFGLRKLNHKPRVGVKELMKVSGLNPGKIKISDVVFKIAPRINAAGRIELGKYAVDLLVENSGVNAGELARKIDDDNLTRKEFDASITDEAIQMLSTTIEIQNKRSTVLYNPTWHKGVIGIVASRIIDYFYKPTVILTRSNGMVTGSARSVSGFNLYEAIEECKDLLVNYGGHMYAAGLTLREDDVQRFTDKFEEVVSAKIQPESLIPKIKVDTILSLDDINPKFFSVLEQFEPFGPRNMAPVFVSLKVKDSGYAQRVGASNEHLKLYITDARSKQSFSAIAFNQGGNYPLLREPEGVDICYNIEENVYKDKRTIQLKVKDIRKSIQTDNALMLGNSDD